MVTYWLNAVWLVYSPDLNLLDYWGIIQVKVIATAHPNGNSLKTNYLPGMGPSNQGKCMEYLPCVEAVFREGHRC
jgi:hypothetical protein